jgi:homoserine/homoserine lactone efflux protein
MIYAISGQKVLSIFSEAGFGKYFMKVIGGTFIGTKIGLITSNK